MLLRKKQYLSLLIISSLITATLFIGCTREKKEPSKSMEVLQKEEGVPVRIETVKTSDFVKQLSFFANLSGIEESTKLSMVADKVVGIKAKVGQNVSQGKVIVTFPSDNPTLQFAQAKAGYENAEKLYKRMQALLKAGETSQQNYDNAETQYIVAKRNFESLKQMIYVEAPISGTIVEMPVKVGDDVRRDANLFTVAKLQTMLAKLWVSESEVNQLKMGMTATIVLNGKEYKGKVTQISLAMDDRTKAFGVEVQFPNPRKELKSGITVNVNIITYTQKNAIVLPRNLIITNGAEKYVFVENNGKAEKRIVETGKETDISVEILSGLTEGDKLITEGETLIKDGGKVNIIQ